MLSLNGQGLSKAETTHLPYFKNKTKTLTLVGAVIIGAPLLVHLISVISRAPTKEPNTYETLSYEIRT
tara:strand:+ start:401 stop:604 length:204 start_codon:yes stop_codon:yes gene_type:complete